MPDSFDYTTGTNSENVRLLQALIDEAPEYTEETNSRNANILKSIINNTEYTDAPQSEIEELLLRLKAKIGGEIEVDELNVTENGTYDAGVNKAYNPVNVELPLSSKTITENGTYTASDDNLAGYNEVTVNVQGYAKKSIPNTPTPIATFNASALPMPSLKVGIEAIQSGTGDPSPTNVRPISGHTEVNVNDSSSNLIDITSYTPIYAPNGITYTINSDGSVVANGTATSRSQVYWSIPQDVAKTFANKKLSGLKTHEGCSLFLELNGSPYTNYGTDMGEGANIDSSIENANTTVNFVIRIASGTTVSNYVVIPRITDELHAYTTNLKDGQGNPITCYGGILSNENGVQSLTLTHGYIASYNGEALPSTWISDRDVYAEGTTPTTGAEVVYTLATPQTIPQDNLAIATQEGTNNLWADSGDVLSGEYMEAL